jgi:hypothetical protein
MILMIMIMHLYFGKHWIISGLTDRKVGSGFGRLVARGGISMAIGSTGG